MGYLERYRAGDHEAVWNELRHIGIGTDDALAQEAEAVADLLMSRARANLERIAAGLKELGYAFEPPAPSSQIDPAIMQSAKDAQAQTAAMLANLDKMGLPADSMAMMGDMAQYLQAMVERASQPLPAFPGIPGPGFKGVQRPLGDNGISVRHVKQFERKVHKLPLALGAFWKTIGHADFEGALPGHDTASWQPFFVLPCLGLVEEYEEYVEDNGSGDDFTVELVANPEDDDYPLGVSLTPGADAKFENGEWFVDHLRRATRSASFLALARADMPPGIAAIADAWEPF
ncbi:hypothetical protein IC614_07195 [Allosphingosinicella flava]|uniref:Uncharacterized protein n=1 Tax=Allosphingosinicella flava TaxID=2771430 RepID=A0A7T2GHV6_9SPHN|nr:hypothetical protein [Sphingosinicella flava]QPQ54155.1 hypothetical protein IC614_07195 [Sphingosinicella flava]